ncbi:hypothetical protein JAU75_21435 [Ochrobactrum sp. Q0168]|uniref:hypothetical protein n=1 Tax=Ochrobactrum sp. Q0168 TaxID=2793241 RepID=UPI0018EBFE3B|nr:hypothetical protein [Ochrobactrum sp. Q0168]
MSGKFRRPSKQAFIKPKAIQLDEEAMILETYLRVFVDPSALENTIAFYRSLLSGEVSLHFVDPGNELELVAISSQKLSVLIIAGHYDKRAPFELTRLTVKVDRLENAIEVLMSIGAVQLEQIQQTPVGRKMRFQHADGMVVEYVDHDGSAAK